MDLFGLTKDDQVRQFGGEEAQTLDLEVEHEGDEEEPTEEAEETVVDDGDEDDIDSFFG